VLRTWGFAFSLDSIDRYQTYGYRAAALQN
jgi:hypothetical protein